MKLKLGFSAIELLVVIGIIVLLSTIVLTNLPRLNRQTRVNVTAEDILRTIRDARVRSVSIAEFAPNSGIFPSYGVFVERSGSQQVVLYADCNIDDNGDNVIDENDDFTFDSSSSTNCLGTNGLVKRVPIDSRVRISDIRKIVPPNPAVSQDRVYVEFLRPEPSIWISDENESLLPLGHIEIDVSDSGETLTKTLYIRTTGHIEVK